MTNPWFVARAETLPASRDRSICTRSAELREAKKLRSKLRVLFPHAKPMPNFFIVGRCRDERRVVCRDRRLLSTPPSFRRIAFATKAIGFYLGAPIQ